MVNLKSQLQPQNSLKAHSLLPWPGHACLCGSGGLSRYLSLWASILFQILPELQVLMSHDSTMAQNLLHLCNLQRSPTFLSLVTWNSVRAAYVHFPSSATTTQPSLCSPVSCVFTLVMCCFFWLIHCILHVCRVF